MTRRSELVSALSREGIAYVLRGLSEKWMVVAPSLGARIMGLGIGEENALWVSPRILRAPWSKGGNVGGQRTWLAPESGPHGFFASSDPSTWDVPPGIDPGDYKDLTGEDEWLGYRTALIARSSNGDEFPLAITRSMRIEKSPDADDSALHVRFIHTLENTGKAVIDKRVGLWCIAQVPSDPKGTIVIPVQGPGAAHPCYEEVPAGMLKVQEGHVLLKTGRGKKYKVGVSPGAARESIAFIRPSRLRETGDDAWVLTVMRFPIDQSQRYVDRPSYPASARDADNGDAVQAYNDPGTGELAFSEIEVHAPAATLGPGESQSQEIEITVAVGRRRELELLIP